MLRLKKVKMKWIFVLDKGFAKKSTSKNSIRKWKIQQISIQTISYKCIVKPFFFKSKVISVISLFAFYFSPKNRAKSAAIEYVQVLLWLII